MSPISRIAVLSWLIQQGFAVPTITLHARNQTLERAQEDYEPAWVAGPKSRGTLGLVFSCVITLFLCVWTTVQVNIEPPENEFNPTLARFIPIRPLKKNQTLLKVLAKRSIRKLGWSFVALIVPEGVMAIAAYERKIASLLCEQVNQIIPKESDQWDMFLAYYAIMGGFVIRKVDYDSVNTQLKGAIDGEKEGEAQRVQNLTAEAEEVAGPTISSDTASKTGVDTIETDNKDEEKAVGLESEEDDDLQNINRLLTLTPYGVLQLVKWQWQSSGQEHDKKLITITSSQVQDKSNANALTKLIVAWQALWMIVQVIGRRASHPNVPITLLELHTCLHAFCAFAMYLTWWNKPVDIDLPTTVHLTSKQILFLRKGESNEPDPTNPWGHETNSSRAAPDWNTSRVFLTSRSGIGKLMYQRLVGHRDIRTEFFSAISDAYIRLWRSKRNFWKESLSISFVGLVFGGVHLAAWNSSFPSYAERVLWQIASTITATTWSGFVLSLWLSVFVEKKKESKIVSKVCGIFLGLGLFPVLIVRVYLLVESFISIRRLPLGSYSLSTWSNIWPHAG